MDFSVNVVMPSEFNPAEAPLKKGAIILCGGRSSRMGHDKATLPFGPELMLQRVIRLVSQVVDSAAIVVVAATKQTLPPIPGNIQVTRDGRPDRGPLEGLAAGLRAMPHGVEAVYATSCDVPLIVPEFITAMFSYLDRYDISVPVDGQFQHPLAAVYRTSVLSFVNSLLDADRLRPRFLFDLVRTAEIPVESLRVVDPDLDTLMNLNNPSDYVSAMHKAGYSG